eukprot:10119-Eustigmatos_ZCMA.PRE.1
MSLGPESLKALCAVLARSRTMGELKSLSYLIDDLIDGRKECEAKLSKSIERGRKAGLLARCV